jgi:predicted nucleic acid-binding protein
VGRHGLAYWDALVWAAAKLNGVANVLSEDFQDGALIEGVRFRDPFAAGFAVDRL